MPESATELGERITNSIAIMPTPEAEERFLPHLQWQLRAMMADVKPSDLTPAELMAVLALLVPAHSRVLTRTPTGGPVLTVLPGGWT